MRRLNRNHKDRLFLRVFSEKEDLLNLYNAVNRSCYTNLDDLEITTLDDIIYMGMKNDVSFLMGDVLNLWEHQSTYNPNMPVRGLSYLSMLYQKYIEQHNINIYSTSLKKLPYPQYIVFYNGRRDEPDRLELKLSDAFTGRQPGDLTEPCLEVRVVMLNINFGKNQELMAQCRKLSEYAQFIAKVREYQDEGMSIAEAVDTAVDICIEQDILADILSSHRAEVIALFMTDYDAQAHMEMERDEWTEYGIERGELIKLIEMVRKKLIKANSPGTIADMLEEDIGLVEKICETIQNHPDMDDRRISDVIEPRRCNY